MKMTKHVTCFFNIKPALVSLDVHTIRGAGSNPERRGQLSAEKVAEKNCFLHEIKKDKMMRLLNFISSKK